MSRTAAAPASGAGVSGRSSGLRKLFDDDGMTLASVYPEGVAVTTPGLFGGRPGGGTHGWLLDSDYRKIKDYGSVSWRR
jgi:5-oxoprolinase (ATP-hydrolysing)/N-methylhydantoinase A